MRWLIPFCLSGLATSACAAGDVPICDDEMFEGVRMTVCTFDPAAGLSLYRADANGDPYGSLKAVRADHPDAAFLMNAGMYHADLSPVGLYVEDGVQAAPLVKGASPGNFGLVPNGVFWIDGGQAGVEETGAFAASGRTPAFATQSGPMLIIDGAIHPKFIATSTSEKLRNGVGVAGDEVIFMLSRDPVNFHRFARAFARRGADNALFLDGTISQLWTKDTGTVGGRSGLMGRYPVGPVVGWVPGAEE